MREGYNKATKARQCHLSITSPTRAQRANASLVSNPLHTRKLEVIFTTRHIIVVIFGRYFLGSQVLGIYFGDWQLQMLRSPGLQNRAPMF
jgi:hypothetical protein